MAQYSNPRVRLVLASGSPRRREIMALYGWDFRILPAEVNETPLLGEDPRNYALRMAEVKARAVAEQVTPDYVVIGADTIVVNSAHSSYQDIGEIIGKPADEVEAFGMLRRLRGHTHQVYTAVAAWQGEQGKLVTALCITDVLMRNYVDEEIAAYIATGDPMDKAGAYAIQHTGFHPVEKVYGCYANVVGLPLCTLVDVLGKFELKPLSKITTACQAELSYQCDVYQEIVKREV